MDEQTANLLLQRNEEIHALREELDRVKAERDELLKNEASVIELGENIKNAIESAKTIVCSYCGYSSAATFDEMREHMSTCAKHPTREAERQRDEWRRVAEVVCDKSGMSAERMLEWVRSAGRLDAGGEETTPDD